MKTAERLDDHWVVDVEDVRDLEGGLPGYRHRFTFEGEGAELDAWQCFLNAEKAGFRAIAERVKRV